jgi:hypothetical protein
MARTDCSAREYTRAATAASLESTRAGARAVNLLPIARTDTVYMISYT